MSFAGRSGRFSQLLRLPPVQPLRDRERRVHPHDAGVEVQLRHAFEAAGRALLDADAAAFAVVHQDLVQAVRAIERDDARLRADQIAVVAGVAGAAAEAAVGLFHRLLFGVRLNDFVLRAAPARRRQHRLLHARELREVGHVHPRQIGDDVDRDHPLLQRLAAEHLVEVERDALAVADGVDHHQRLAGAELHDVAGGEELRVAEASEPVDLDRAALVLELVRQPRRATRAGRRR